jgi:hypothetical protein
MTKTQITCLTLLGIVLLIGICVISYIYQGKILKNNLKKEHVTNQTKKEFRVTTNNESKPENDKYSLSILIGSNQVGIDDKEENINLPGLLGEPISQKTEVSGKEAFPYAGISFKTIEYEGLIITFYGSKDGSNKVCNIKVSNEKYSTPLGIKVGDSLERLQEVYPVQNNEEQYGPGVYSLYGDKTGWGMFFHITDNKITNIEINAEWD